MSASPYIIETPRMGLREYHADDAEGFHALCQDPEVMRYIIGEQPPESVRQWRDFLVDYPDYGRHGFGRWTCIHKATGRFMGFSGLKYLEDMDGQVDLGYRFAREFWGQGYATEAGLPSVRYGFEVLGLERIIGLVMPENIASVRVLEKCGMKLECHMEFAKRRIALYAVHRES